MALLQYVVFFKYRRKCAKMLLVFFIFAISGNCEEIFQCNNQTQTCITEQEHIEQNDQGTLPFANTMNNNNDPNLRHCRGKIILNQNSGFVTDGPGNYSLNVRCSWVLQSPVKNSTIRLQLLEFASECSWDHLYVYDGDSVFAPLLAVFSGVTLSNGYRVREINELTSSSDVILLHFYSDLAVNMTGFNMSYSIKQCPTDSSNMACYGNGVCIDGSCTCDAGFTGNGCQFSICPNNCSQHGRCNMEQHSCICDEGWMGLDCSQQRDRGSWTKLPALWTDKTSSLSVKQLERTQSSGGVWKGRLWVVGGHSFNPRAPFTLAFNLSGSDWSAVSHSGESVPAPRFGHTAVIHDGVLYMFGGVTQEGQTSSQLWTLDLATHQWNLVTLEKSENCQQRVCGPVGTSGHGGVLVKDKMYIIFGHNPIYGYLNWIQEYSIDSNVWTVLSTTGALVQGSYGPSTVWDPLTKKIYIYGGYQSESSSTYGLTDALYSFDPSSKSMRVHTPSGSFRFLHTAVMSGGLMLVYGGNTHNETTLSNGAKCYAADFIAYDVFCDSWYRLPAPSTSGVADDLARYGHLTLSIGLIQDNESLEDYQQPLLPQGMIVFGGFDGQLKSDVLVYDMGSCTGLTNKDSCLNTMPGVKCVWNKSAKKCEPLTNLSKDGYEKCPGNLTNSGVSLLNPGADASAHCAAITTCPSCLQTTFNCVWCGHSCQYSRCKESVNANGKMVTVMEQCETGDASTCKLFHSCQACHTEQHCRWESDARCYTYVRKVGNRTEKAELTREDQLCDLPCSMRTSCKNCTQGSCLWCANQNRCIEKNAYVPSFPYGLCTDWTAHDSKCKESDAPEPIGTMLSSSSSSIGGNIYIKMTTCNAYKSCASCQDDPACGWCDDASNTGTGVCLPGGLNGPLSFNSSVYGNSSTECPLSRWYFTRCPLCQCNGHSTCAEGSQQCIQPCQHLTEGPHCEHCIAGYYGNPINGGTCVPCQCNGHGSMCHHSTGRCFCTTKGVVGDHCEKCDTANHYTAGTIALHPGSGNSSLLATCYYDLQLDFQFTFNLSKKEDRHIGQINFRNTPLKPDVDLDFSISCSIMARLNISIRTAKFGNEEDEEFIYLAHNCTQFKKRFFRTDHKFGSEENTTFCIYVYDFKAPIQIIVSFSQQPKLELQQFFITFSACFISLLGMAAILWKIKQKYDMYRRRQRLFVEMEQMASRPFAHVFVELQVPKNFPRRSQGLQLRGGSSSGDSRNQSVAVNISGPETNSPQTNPAPSTTLGSQAIRRRRKLRVSPIALEPCSDQKAAVLSLLIRLPNGTLPYTPPGQSGLAIGSTLVSLGSQANRKSSSGPSDLKETRPLPKAKTPPSLSQIT